MCKIFKRKEGSEMCGKNIVSAVKEELQKQASAACGYDNYQYPDKGDDYSNDDSDDSPSEQ